MASRLTSKNRPAPLSVSFGSFMLLDFTATPVANANNTMVADYICLPVACKVIAVAVAMSSGASGLTAFNVVIGGAAEAGILTPDNTDQVGSPPSLNTIPGLSLFQAGAFPNFSGPQDQVLTAAPAYGGTRYFPSEPDAIFPAGTVLTLRLVSGPAVAGTCEVRLLAVPVDIVPNRPTNALNGLNYVNDLL